MNQGAHTLKGSSANWVPGAWLSSVGIWKCSAKRATASLPLRQAVCLAAGLRTSTCVLLTTASAMQQAGLVALVADCCADEPHAHNHTLERYTFLFARTPVGVDTPSPCRMDRRVGAVGCVQGQLPHVMARRTAHPAEAWTSAICRRLWYPKFGTVTRSSHPCTADACR